MNNEIEQKKQQLKDELDALKQEFKFELPAKIAKIAFTHGRYPSGAFLPRYMLQLQGLPAQKPRPAHP